MYRISEVLHEIYGNDDIQIKTKKSIIFVWRKLLSNLVV